MTYQETVSYLFNSTPVFEHVGAAAYKEGLETTRALDAHFNHPHHKYKTIHVAGTNGKGSCSHTLAAILQSEGYKVGLYTSPHLVDFRERIRVNGVCIDEQRVVDFVEQERAFFEPLHPSFFELTTALAFLYFAEQKVDVAVIEVGLGGRLDCTNIITPVLSVITNISFDHTQFLGNTLEKIAGEKAGIIKPKVPVVVGETTAQTRPVFQAKAQELQAPLFFAEDAPEVISVDTHVPEQGFIYHTQSFGELQGELTGIYQAKNTNTVLSAVKQLRKIGLVKHEESIRRGMNEVTLLTHLAGRWQTIGTRPLMICDTGHNAAGWTYLSRQITAVKCRQLHMVFGMVDDKDIDTVMAMLPRNARYYWTQADNHRAIPAETVAQKGAAHQLTGSTFHSVSEAVKAAMQNAQEDDFIFIGGSSYIVADLLSTKC